jgi:hypothetical protein
MAGTGIAGMKRLLLKEKGGSRSRVCLKSCNCIVRRLGWEGSWNSVCRIEGEGERTYGHVGDEIIRTSNQKFVHRMSVLQAKFAKFTLALGEGF